MKILIADDDASNRCILRAMLANAGHDVVEAEDGARALALYAQERPELVLLDVLMPHRDGYEVARAIKAQAHERFVPIIFLTALSDEAAMRRGIECGGDDFLTKPYNLAVLQSKLLAMERIRGIHRTLEQQRDELRHKQATIDHELAVGAHILSTITRRANLDLPGIRFFTMPMSRFNGDLLIAARKPTGGLYLMLADFTGHGLSAAVGAIPTAEVFYGMAAKGFALSEILEELNGKLHSLLPTGLFCSACLMELDAAQGTLAAWNGGLPDVLVTGDDGCIRQRIRSTHLPLGVTVQPNAEWQPETLLLEDNPRVYLYSDGVIEAANADGVMYGSERLERHFARGAGEHFETISRDLTEFRAGSPQQDDITLIEVDCRRVLGAAARDAVQPAATVPASTWASELYLEPDSLRMLDPLPILISLLLQLKIPPAHRDSIYVVLAELYSNALDHGLLGLDSRLKSGADGFARYYALREERLAGLHDGWVRIALEHEPRPAGGALTVHVHDSGRGFDHSCYDTDAARDGAFSGRGIPLVRSLCRSLCYAHGGRLAEAVYAWGPVAEPRRRCAQG